MTRFLALFLLVACGGGGADVPNEPGTTSPTTGTTASWGSTLGEFDDAGGLSGSSLVNPFPNPWLIDETGHVDIPADQLPATNTPFPTLRVSHRTGFSPAQAITLRVPGFDCSGCPGWHTPTPGQGSVILFDRTTQSFLPVMAELDAWEGANNPTTLIRPQQALPVGHEIAVVITTDAMERPARFQALVDGTADSRLREHYLDLVADIEGMGLAIDDVALAWDFPVGDPTIKLRSTLDQVQVPAAWTWAIVKDADAGDSTPSGMWRVARGSLEVQDFLSDDKLALNPDGTVNQTGTTTAPLVIAIPDAVKDAPAGTVPVIVYGHTLLGSAKTELFDFSGAIHEIASEMGAIVIATDWGGLDSGDMLVAVSVANDFGKMPRLTGRMVQGQASQHALIKAAVDGALLADPVLLGAQGQQLADVSSVRFWGMSLGGILGGVLVGQDAPIDAAVFNVGGGGWSHLLERSSNWTTFEFMVTSSVPDPADRQLFYALAQLFWDPVDPISYAEDLKGERILIQESYGDDAVCNMATRMLARSIDLPVLEPEVDAPFGLSTAPADLPVGSRALVQFDAERAMPADINRPASPTGAHTETTYWLESIQQGADFLSPGAEGQVNHYCGATPCTRTTVQ